MRIAYLNPQPVPDTTPSSLQILQFADAVAAQGHQVDLVTPAATISAEEILGRRSSQNLRLQPLPDHRYRWYFPFSSSRLFHGQAIKWLARNPVDAVYLRNLKLGAAILRGSLGIPVFFETHELFAQSFREDRIVLDWRARRKLAVLSARESLVYRQVNGVIAITQALANDIRTTYQLVTPILVAPDAVDLDLASAALRHQKVGSEGQVIVLYLGSLHKWKGVETLLDATAFLSNCRLWIAGGGSARVAELGMHPAVAGHPGRVTFLGQVAPRQRFTVIADADICVLPLSKTSIGSRYTSPLKLFEYMAMGKAIIASDHPSIREILSDGENAVLVPAENAQALAAALSRLIADPIERARLGSRARELSLSFSWLSRARDVMRWVREAAIDSNA